NFQDLNICNNADCAPLVRPQLRVDAQNIINVAPNPSGGETTVTFYTEGGHTLLQLVSKEGVPLQTLLETTYGAAQTISKRINLSSYETGMYYIRYQNGRKAQMKPVIKVK